LDSLENFGLRFEPGDQEFVQTDNKDKFGI